MAAPAPGRHCELAPAHAPRMQLLTAWSEEESILDDREGATGRSLAGETVRKLSKNCLFINSKGENLNLIRRQYKQSVEGKKD